MYASLPWRSSSMVTVTAVHDEFILPELRLILTVNVDVEPGAR